MEMNVRAEMAHHVDNAVMTSMQAVYKQSSDEFARLQDTCVALVLCLCVHV